MNRVKFTFTEDSDDAGFDTIQDLVSTWKSDSVLDTPNCMSRASTYTALLGTNDEFERSAAERCSDEHEVSVDNDEFSLDTCCPQLRLKVKVCEAENNSVQNHTSNHQLFGKNCHWIYEFNGSSPLVKVFFEHCFHGTFCSC